MFWNLWLFVIYRCQIVTVSSNTYNSQVGLGCGIDSIGEPDCSGGFDRYVVTFACLGPEVSFGVRTTNKSVKRRKDWTMHNFLACETFSFKQSDFSFKNWTQKKTSRTQCTSAANRKLNIYTEKAVDVRAIWQIFCCWESCTFVSFWER